MLRWVSIGLSATFVASPAIASPWSRGDSELYARLAISRHTVDGLDGIRWDSYSEYGLSDDWTVSLKYERLEFDRFGEFDRDGWRVTVRRGFTLPKGLVFALEGGALSGDAIGGAAGCETLGAEARVSIGQSTRVGGDTVGQDIFWFAEGAVRAHEDGCQRERAEIGLGQRLYKDVWLVSQAWFDSGDSNASSSKYQFEYLWKADGFDISAGTLIEFGGEFDESAVFFAVARTF